MNITLQIIAVPNQDAIADPAKNARRYAVGDFVCVWDAAVVAPYDGANHILRDVISNQRYVFVHVRDVPAQVTLERARSRLLLPDYTMGVDGEGEPTITAYYRRTRFAAILADIPAGVRNLLLTDRQITVTWTQVKNYVKHVRENRQLVDGDL